MKKNISNFLKKAEDDPQMAARLDIARQHYIREVMLLKGDLRVPYRLRNKRKIKEDYQRYVTENICFLKEGKGSGKRMG